MLKDDHRIGVTPILIRRAGFYLSLGIGEYFPEHPHYDKVVVEQSYAIQSNPDNESEWSQGFTVSFFKDDRRIRWIDFGSRLTGAGGDSILRKVDNNE